MSIKNLQNYTYYAKYARYLEKEQRRETWNEAIDRVIDMHLRRYPQVQEEIEWIRPLMKEKRFLGSQRALQYGGEPIEKKHSRIYNCLHVDTKFITSHGVKSFRNFNHNDEITVLTHKGNWEKAIVKCYGEQEINKISVTRGEASYEFFATKNHRWILKNGDFTESLQEGDQLYFAPNIYSEFDYYNSTPLERLYWCYGYVYGDGSLLKDKNGLYKHSAVRLCDHDVQYEDRFLENGFSSSSSASLEGDVIVSTGKYLKTLPDPQKDSPELIRAFVAGYLSADGTKSSSYRNGQKNGRLSQYQAIQATGEESISFIRNCFPIAGIYIVSEKDISDQITNFGKRKDKTIFFRIIYAFGQTAASFRVSNIVPQSKETVWCLEVENDQSFVMPMGLTTGNCVAGYCDRLRFFQETFWLLLAGCGVGFSVQKHHVAKLPRFNNSARDKKKVYNIPDTIEGWADSLGVLLSTYFDFEEFSEYKGYYVEFNYDLIRPEGSLLSSGVGKAPGPEPLRNALEKIRILLDDCVKNEFEKLRSIDAYDIVMHASDAVLSGGVRRCIAKGQKVLTKNGSYKNIEDIDIGDFVLTENGWKKVKNCFVQGKQKTLKIKHSQGELICTPNHKIAVLCNIFGEFVWKKAEDLTVDDRLFFCRPTNFYGENKFPEYKYISPKCSTTCKKITIPELDEDMAWFIGIFQGDGYVRLTEKLGEISVAVHENDIDQAILIEKCIKKFGVNVRIQQPKENEKCFKVRCKSKQLAEFLYKHVKQPKTCLKVPNFIKEATQEIRAAYLKGIMDSDGCVKTRPQQIVVSVYKEWIKELQNLMYSIGVVTYQKQLCVKNKNWQNKYALVITNNDDILIFSSLSKKYFKQLSLRKFNKSKNNYKPSMVGEISNYKLKRNNCNYTTAITSQLGGNKNIVPIKINSIEMFEELETFDIEVEDNHSFICEGVLVHNSATLCIFSPDDQDMIKAKTGNWFYENPQRGRSNNSALLIRNKTTKEKFLSLIESVKEFGEPGFIWADDTEALFNPCVEIGLYGYDEHGNSGFHACNLCEINGKKIKTIEDFEIAAKGAAILGTLQAGYTDFPYLGPVSENIIRKEALLGVSITGMMDSPEILFNPEIQKQMAELIKKTNREIAKKIGINSSARSTCVKPAGSTSCVLGTASGIHPHHAKRYFRRVQANQLEPVLQHFKKFNPIAIEKSVWSANKTDDVITFCIEVPPGAKTKNDLSAIDLLEYVKLTQQNWVSAGKDESLCVKSWLNHNVSNTVNVKENEWDDVANYIYNNRDFFAGISLLPASGDLDYPQAPMANVLNHKEIINEYGEGSLLASGLIVDGLHVFDNLWEACDVVLGRGNPLLTPKNTSDKNDPDMVSWMKKEDWIRRVKQFADRYCNQDLVKCTRLLKHVHNWKMWLDLNREYKDVDYTSFFEESNNVKLNETVACAGGTCELIF